MSKGLLDWPAESIQATIFVPQKHEVPAASLFEVCFGHPPTSTQENANPQFGRLGAASLQRGSISENLILQPGRCDVILGSIHDPSNFDGTGKISDVAPNIETIKGAAMALVPHVGEIARLAISIRLTINAKNTESANKSLLAVMPYKLPLTKEEDFILQTNWQTTLGSYKINRLARWSSESIIMSLEQMIPGMTRQVVNNEATVAVVALDFNTWPGHTKFSQEKALDVLDVLASELMKARKNELRLMS